MPPPTVIFSQSQRIKISDSHFVKLSQENIIAMSLGEDLLPHSPRGRGMQVTNFDQCLHTAMVTGKEYRRFQGIGLIGWGWKVEWRELHGRIFPWWNLSWGKRNSMKGTQDLLALCKKKTVKILIY